MIELKPNVLYTRADLAAMLEPAGVDVDFFIARIKARKVFKMLWLGEDILAALRSRRCWPIATRPASCPRRPIGATAHGGRKPRPPIRSNPSTGF